MGDRHETLHEGTIAAMVEGRRRALRGRWPRLAGNDGKMRVRPPDDLSAPCAPDVRPDAKAADRTDPPLVSALQAHVETLKEQLAQRDGRRAGEDREGYRRICRAGGSARPAGG